MDTSGEHNEDWRADVRISGDLADRAEKHVDETGKPKAQVVREALDEYLPDSDTQEGPRIKPPATEDLQTALSILQRLAEPNGGIVPRDVALSELAQHFSRSTNACLTTLVKPLEDDGYVKTRGGLHARKSLRVVLPSDVSAIVESVETPLQGTGDGEEDSLDYNDSESVSDRLDVYPTVAKEASQNAD